MNSCATAPNAGTAPQNVTFTPTDAANYHPATGTVPVTVTAANPDTDNDGMPDAWETANGLTVGIDDSAADPDGDTQSNAAEYTAGTNPQAGNSVFAVESFTLADGAMILNWTGVAGRTYQVWSSPDLRQWTRDGASIPCTTTGPLSATAPTTAAAQRFFKLSVEP